MLDTIVGRDALSHGRGHWFNPSRAHQRFQWLGKRHKQRARVHLNTQRFRQGFSWFTFARTIFWIAATAFGSCGMCYWWVMLTNHAPAGGEAVIHLAMALLCLWAREQTPS